MTIRLSNISLRQLRAFRGTLEAGSLTAAADTLGITQSGLSQSISGLEEALGVQLVIRDRDGVRPTAVGRQVLGDAEAALRAVERMEDRASAYLGAATGTLRIGSVASAASRLLPNALGTLREQHPSLDIDVIEGTDEEVADWATAGVIDIGFTAETRPGLAEAEILADEYVAVVPKGHIAHGRRRMPLSGMPGPFVMPGASCEPPIYAMFDAAGTVPDVVCKVRGTASLISMVRAGIGFTIVPELSLPEGLPKEMIVGLEPPEMRRLLAIRDASIPPTPAVEALLGEL